MSSRRAKRVAEKIRQAASNVILFELKDPRVKLVTVTGVEVTADLRYAKVFVSVMEGEKSSSAAMHGLKHARGHIQRRIAKDLDIKFAPMIEFVEDESVKKGVRMSKLIKKALEGEEWLEA